MTGRFTRESLWKRLHWMAFGFTLGAWGALCLHPASRALVLTHGREILTKTYTPRSEENLDTFVERMNVRQLAQRHPDSAQAQADFLRQALIQLIPLRQGRISLLDRVPMNVRRNGNLEEVYRPAWLQINDPLNQTDRDALAEIIQRGERLEPRNSFFPIMRLFLALRSNDLGGAALALDRAAHADYWQDYALETLTAPQPRENTATVPLDAHHKAMQRYFREGIGMQENLSRLGRCIAAIAMTREREGRYEEGIWLRSRLVRLGARLFYSQRAPLQTVSLEYFTVAMMNLEGNAQYTHLLLREEMSSEDYGKRQQYYFAHLKRHGATQEAAWMQTFLASLRPSDSPERHPSAEGYRHYLDRYLLSVFPLSLTLLWALTVGVASSLCYWRRFQASPTLKFEPSILWGVGIGCVVWIILSLLEAWRNYWLESPSNDYSSEWASPSLVTPEVSVPQLWAGVCAPLTLLALAVLFRRRRSLWSAAAGSAVFLSLFQSLLCTRLLFWLWSGHGRASFPSMQFPLMLTLLLTCPFALVLGCALLRKWQRGTAFSSEAATLFQRWAVRGMAAFLCAYLLAATPLVREGRQIAFRVYRAFVASETNRPPVETKLERDAPTQ